MNSDLESVVAFFANIANNTYCANFVLLDVRGRVRSQITCAALQIQRFDFDCNLVLTNRFILGIPPALRFKKTSILSTTAVPKFSTRYTCTHVSAVPS